ncbi:efflux transporter outer membrane subunit [Mesorhizobium sp. PUT5]|uniref:efflux transporter outer membrane subunit n=1 Tax=Mesorhizobium sp. PUT5 TaxID=3454629 RepID=UPI003FA471C5
MRCVARGSVHATRANGRWPFGRILAVCLTGLGLSGCILGTEHPDAALEVPAAYGAGPRHPDAAVPALDWWQGFRSKELTGLIEQAQISNLDIAVAVAQIIQADAQAGIAGAPLLPSLTGGASAERIRQQATVGGGASVFSQYNLGLTASYMLDFWGKNRATLFAAEKNALASRYNHEVVALSTVVSVANTYFQILAAQDELKVARSNLAASTRILNLIQKQFAAGTASQLDVSQQAALVAQVRASIPPLEVTRRQNIAALAVLVARAPADFKVNGPSLSRISVPRVTPGLPSELLVRRPDIRQAEAQLAASNFSVESARAAFLPQIGLTGTTGYQSAALSSLFAPGAWYYTLAASLTQPIFDGFLLKSELKQARGVQLQFLQSYRKAVLSAFGDVEMALVALEQTTIQLRLQGDVVANSRKAFEVAEAQLNGGTVNLISVLQAEQTLFTAESTLVQVRLNRLLAETSLFQALGGGWNKPELQTASATQ